MTDKELKAHLRSIAGAHIDESNILDTTAMVEETCDHFDLYVGADCEIPERIFELAFEVGEVLTKEWGLNE